MTRLTKLSAAFLAIYMTAGNCVAQEQKMLEPAVKKATEINQSAAKSQQTINRITSQIDSKLQQFKTINKETTGLDVYNGQLQKQIDNQIQEMADLNASIDGVSIIERQITPLMMRMISGLAQFVALDQQTMYYQSD